MNTSKERTKRFLEARLEAAFEAAAENEHGISIEEVKDKGNDFTFSIRREVVRQFKKIHKQAVEEFFKSFDLEYAHELRRDGDVFPMVWMTNDKELWSAIGNKKSIFIPLLNHLWSSRMNINDSKRLSIQLGAGKAKMTTRKGEQVTRDFIFIEGIDYEDLGKKVNASKSTIYNYIRALVKQGILIQFGKDGSRGRMVYAMGYFLPYKTRDKSGFKQLPFVNEKMKHALREFNVYE
ncbi:MAG TPA: hypothetical protein VLX29_02875 [Nitrospirota bacterium]|nr:hypothetical protein [Nitrospirota bacterium]